MKPEAGEGEESKEEGQSKKKKKKKVAFASDQDKKIRVIKLKRSGKKVVCIILGLDDFGCDLEKTAKQMSKKMGTGAAAMMSEYREIKQMAI